MGVGSQAERNRACKHVAAVRAAFAVQREKLQGVRKEAKSAHKAVRLLEVRPRLVVCSMSSFVRNGRWSRLCFCTTGMGQTYSIQAQNGRKTPGEPCSGAAVCSLRAHEAVQLAE